MKVYNMTSPASGREVANQFEIYDDNRNQFLGFGIEETRRRIKDGRIKLENLN